MIVSAAQEQIGLGDSLKNLMERTGLGNKKVGPMKSWAVRSGLVSKSKLSLEADKVVANDPYLRSSVTDWFMHFYLSFSDKGLASAPESPEEWGGWTWFVYSFLPEQFAFSTDNLIYEAAQVFEDETNKKLKRTSDSSCAHTQSLKR